MPTISYYFLLLLSNRPPSLRAFAVATATPPSRLALDAGTKCRAYLEFPKAYWHHEVELQVQYIPQSSSMHSAAMTKTRTRTVIDRIVIVPSSLVSVKASLRLTAFCFLRLSRRCCLRLFMSSRMTPNVCVACCSKTANRGRLRGSTRHQSRKVVCFSAGDKEPARVLRARNR